MAASLLRSFAVLVTILAFVLVGDSAICPDLAKGTVHNFVDGNCIYVRNIHVESWKGGINLFEEACRNLSQYPYEWSLPKLDSTKKNDDLAAIIQLDAGRQGWNYFPIGLIRDQPTENDTLWRDWTKWRWTLDNSTLISFPNAPWEEPYPSEARIDHRCVVAVHRGSNVLKWHDEHCDGVKADYLTHLVCESRDVSSTMPVAKSIKNSSSKANCGESLWLYFGIGFSLPVVFAIAIGVVWHRKRRRNQSGKKNNPPDNQTKFSMSLASNSKA